MERVALITGASSGIGKELARIHAKQGDVILVARSEDKLNQLKEELESQENRKAMVIAKDLTSPTAAQEIHQQVTKAGIEVDYLINNAGFGGQGLFYERSLEADLAMIQLNVVALTALTRLFLPDVLERNRGRILNVSSTASLMPGPLQAVYYATKAYVTSFSNAIASELENTPITVTNLMPGATETEFAKTSGMDKTSLFQHTFSAKEVAKAGYQGMMAGKLDVYAGLTFSQRVLMGAIPFLPKKVVLKQIRSMQEISE